MATLRGFAHHDHTHCIADCVAVVETACAEAGLRLTDQRRRVLEILLRDHRALGAYQILEELRRDGLAAQPPVAYRALDFLVGHGFAHKVERLNAFVACTHPGDDHAPVFLICRLCRTVAEAPAGSAAGAVDAVVQSTGFAVETATIEAVGLCPDCAAA